MRNILFVLLLLLPSVCFGQTFQNVVDSSLYPNTGNNIIPPSGEYAILAWSHIPSQISGSIEILSVDIIPSVNGVGKASSSYGWYYTDPETDIRYWWSIIDSSTLYARSGNGVPSWLLTRIQSKLEEKNLGTISQRQALINSFSAQPVQIINPSDIYAGFLNLFGPYANIFIGVFLTLFVVDLMTRKTKATVAESAKVARAAERREINQQIKNDTTAQVYKYRLSNLAGIKSGRIQDSEISQSQARRMFRETAEEYAEYRRSRGWVY